MYVYIHGVFNIHSQSSCLFQFDIATELRFFVGIGVTGGGGAIWNKCPLVAFCVRVGELCVFVFSAGSKEWAPFL